MDKRGQIVIPKDIRSELSLEDGVGFWIYSITKEGILLKKVESKPLEEHAEILAELDEKSSKISVKKENIQKSVQKYKKTTDGKLDVI